MSKVIECECGHTVRGESEEELLANAREHIADSHPDMVGQVSDEQLLSMAGEG
jgi:predicted small metal-binding protein